MRGPPQLVVVDMAEQCSDWGQRVSPQDSLLKGVKQGNREWLLVVLLELLGGLRGHSLRFGEWKWENRPCESWDVHKMLNWTWKEIMGVGIWSRGRSGPEVLPSALSPSTWFMKAWAGWGGSRGDHTWEQEAGEGGVPKPREKPSTWTDKKGKVQINHSFWKGRQSVMSSPQQSTYPGNDIG